MERKIFLQAIAKFLSGLVLTGLLIFLPAGAFYANGWLLILIMFVPMFVAGLVMMLKNPELLKKRLNVREKQKEQKTVLILSALMFLFGFAAAGFTVRLDLYMLPAWAVSIAAMVFLAGYAIYAMVLVENKYLSRTVEVVENQKVVDTGLYGVVRHPMYSATLLLFLSMPLILGSVYAFVIFLAYPAIIVKRIKNEEEVLERELEGYINYKQKVKYRLIPFVW